MKKAKQIPNPEKRVLYFAYGSNLSSKRIRARLGKTINLGTYRLQGYRLLFDCGTRETSFANIIEDLNSYVEGVIYEMDYWQLKELDWYEGLYHREKIDLREGILMGRKLHFYISYLRRADFYRPLTQSYFSALITGARENNLQELELKLSAIEDLHVVPDPVIPRNLNYFFNW